MANVVPKHQSDQGWSVEGGFAGGSYTTLQENAALGFRKGPFDIYAAESLVTTEGHVAHSGAYQQNYYVNTGYWINACWNFRAIFNFSDAETLHAPATGQSKSDMLATYKTDTIFATATLNNEYDRANGLFKLYILPLTTASLRLRACCLDRAGGVYSSYERAKNACRHSGFWGSSCQWLCLCG
jgi:hypothetical protein